jgi:hypothetical protein
LTKEWNVIQSRLESALWKTRNLNNVSQHHLLDQDHHSIWPIRRNGFFLIGSFHVESWLIQKNKVITSKIECDANEFLFGKPDPLCRIQFLVAIFSHQLTFNIYLNLWPCIFVLLDDIATS